MTPEARQAGSPKMLARLDDLEADLLVTALLVTPGITSCGIALLRTHAVVVVRVTCLEGG